MCFEVELFLHPIPISLCNLAKEISTSIIWVWVQGTTSCTHHDSVFFKIDKACYKILCMQTMPPFPYKVHPPFFPIARCILNIVFPMWWHAMFWVEHCIQLAMEWRLTQHTMPTLHHEGNDTLKMVHVGTCAQNPPPFQPIWVEVDWAGSAIMAH